MKIAIFLSHRLPGLRKRFELTQEAFAEKTGFDYKFYQAIESGRRKHLRVDTLERLAAAYGLQPWELIGPGELEKAKRPRLVKPSAANPDTPRKAGRPGRPKAVKVTEK